MLANKRVKTAFPHTQPFATIKPDPMDNGSSSPAAIEVRDLVVDYGDRRALDSFSLAVEQGAIVGLLGPNGSGKSTLLSVIAGLRRPQQGTVRVLNEKPGPATRARIGVVLQESSLDPLMTAQESLSLHGRLFGLRGGALHDRVENLLEQFGLSSRAKDAVGTLSGGLRRRLELTRALVPSPKVLLLDEPSSGLDPESRRTLWEHLRAARATGVTLLLATHDVIEAERECDIVVFLHEGKLVAQGPPAELKAGLRPDAVLVECNAGMAAQLTATIAEWPGVGRVTSADSVLHVTVDEVSSFVPRLFQAGGSDIRSIRIDPSTLEDAYFELAGTSLSMQPQEDAPMPTVGDAV